ncbi:MAG: chromate transporter [Firmicutes bacterium]|nr:chromate transporter [Bacillota bacterium]NBI61560.1 chromate transporter [Clostridiales bacterium]
MKESRRQAFKIHGSLFWEFFKIGLFTIGGGMAMLPLIQKVVVEDRNWLGEEEMIDCLAISQSLPGAQVVSCAAYVGKRYRGLTGSIAAALGIIMPSFLIIIAVVTLLGTIGDNSYVNGAFTGIKAAVCGLVILSACRLGKQVMKGPFQWVMASLAFIAIGIFRVNALWAIAAGAVIGILVLLIHGKRRTKT